MEIGAYIEDNRQALLAWGTKICGEVCAEHGVLLKVPAAVRVKEPQSARAKQIKKGYADPSKDMTDLVGVRFVVLTSSDIEPIRATIKKSSTWNAVQARDPAEEIERAPDTFGYQSHHYELRPADAGGGNWCCEVQVRTLLQHTIAELSHDSMYKATQAIPSHARRLVARSMALMETTDELLCRAMQAVREADAPALAVRRVANEVTQSLDGLSATGLLEDLLSAYAADINGGSAESLRSFVHTNEFVIERMRARREEGIFAYPSAAVVGYWLVDQLEQDVVGRWPFPGSRPELMKIFSDLGISP